MFGISWAELLVILLVAVIVIPVNMWPDVARFLARAVKFIRKLIWKITDISEQIKNQVDLQKPIDDLLKTSTDDILADFATPLVRDKKKIVKKIGGKRKNKCKK